jgi:hypothetical protein
VTIEGVTLELRPTDAGQVGCSPSTPRCPWLGDEVARRTGEADPSAAGPRPAVLHLFAYTGLATLATVAAGARVTHVDASRPAVGWARGNATRSGLAEAPVRWIVDDAVAFTGREVRRGRRYAGVILDPPSYGHGPGTGAWQLERDRALLDACAEAEPDGFMPLTTTPRVRRRPPGATSPPRYDGRRGSMEAATWRSRRPMAESSGWRLRAVGGAGMMTPCARPPPPVLTSASNPRIKAALALRERASGSARA